MVSHLVIGVGFGHAADNTADGVADEKKTPEAKGKNHPKESAPAEGPAEASIFTAIGAIAKFHGSIHQEEGPLHQIGVGLQVLGPAIVIYPDDRAGLLIGGHF